MLPPSGPAPAREKPPSSPASGPPPRTEPNDGSPPKSAPVVVIAQLDADDTPTFATGPQVVCARKFIVSTAQGDRAWLVAIRINAVTATRLSSAKRRMG